MAFVEVQMSTARMFEALREGLRESLVAVISNEWSAAGQTLMLDHIDVLNDTTLEPGLSGYDRERWDDWPYHRSGIDQLSAFPEVPVPTAPVVVQQSLTIYPGVLLGRGTDNPTLVKPPGLTVVFSLSVEAIVVEQMPPPGAAIPPTAAALRFSTAQVAFPDIPGVAAPLTSAASDAIVAAIGSQTVVLPDSPLGHLEYSNGGVTALGGEGRLAIRFQAGLGSDTWTTGQWTNFHQGGSPDLTDPGLGGGAGPHGDWGVRIDSSLLANTINNTITYELTKPGVDRSKVWLETRGVQVDIVPAGGHVRIVTSLFLGVATGVLGVTAEVEVTITGDVDVISPGVLRIHLQAHAAVNLSLDTALLLVVVGLAIGAALGLAAVVIPGGVLLVPIAVISAVAVLATLGPLPMNVLPASAAPACVEGGLDLHAATLSADKTLDCTVPVASRLPLVRRADVTTTGLYVLGSDIVASGQISPLPELPAPTFSVTVWDWSWAAPPVPCRDAASIGGIIERFKKDPSAARCQTAISLDGTPAGAAPLVAAYVASDPQGVVSATVQDSSTVAVSVSYDPAFLANPHPIYVLVHTTAGIQLLLLGPLPAFDLGAMTAQMLSGVTGCFVIEDSFFAHFHRYNPKWGVDPYRAAETGIHWWDATVSGLNPGESIEVYGGFSAEPVAVMEADRGGAMQATLLTSAAIQGTDEFALQRTHPRSGPGAMAVDGGDENGRAGHSIQLVQTLLGRRSRIEVASEVLAADIGHIRGAELLSVVRDGALDIYNVSLSGQPRLVTSIAVAGAIGTRIGAGRLLVFGPAGLDEVAGDPLTNRLYLRSLSRIPTVDVAVWRRDVLVLHEEGLARIDISGQLECLQRHEGGQAIAGISDALVLAGETAVKVFTGPPAAEPVGRIEGLKCLRFLLGANRGSGSGLVAEVTEGFVSLEFLQPAAPRVSGRHSQKPAHASILSSGRMFATVSDDGLSLDLLTTSARIQC